MNGDAVIVAVPVYEDQVPSLLADFFDGLKAKGQPAVIVVVYGNIGYGPALNQLMAMTEKCNLQPIAAAAFVAQHSFSTEDHPVASGRPDSADLVEAREFGAKIKMLLKEKINKTLIIPKGKKSLMALMLPKNSAKLFTLSPSVDNNRCIGCKICAEKCPENAIDLKTLKINKEKCIRCFACVKYCGPKARKITFRLSLAQKILCAQGKHQKKNDTYFINN